MRLCPNKKSELVRDKIGYLVLITISLIIIFNFIPFLQSTAEAKTTESICRGSIALRDKSYTPIKEHITHFEVEFTSVATPLLGCKTIDKYIPENKDATKEQVEKEIADSMAKTWETFGEGRIHDVFKEGDQFNKNCFIFYTVSFRETSKFKAGATQGTITSAELRQYLFDHPYKAYPEGDFCKVTGGFCENAENSAGCNNKINAPSTYLLFEPAKGNKVCEKKGKKGCCYTDYACWNKGGTCSKENPNANDYVLYSEWDCPKNTQCYIKKGNYYSYGDYIQKYGGPGNIIIKTNGIKPGETYAVSLGSPTKNCGWCDEAAKSGAAGGAVAGVGTILVALAQGGAAAAVAATPIGAAAIVGGWIIFGYVGTKVTTEITNEQIGQLLDQRKINTIYFTTLNEMQQGNHCSIVQG